MHLSIHYHLAIYKGGDMGTVGESTANLSQVAYNEVSIYPA